MKILVTGFDPFDGATINPAIESVKRLPDRIKDVEIIKLEIPTVFYKSAQIVREAIKKYHPDYVLNVGQAGGRFGLTPERVAININDGRIPDNDGYQPLGDPIEKDGATAYFTQLPIKAEVAALKENGLPAEVSNTAGTYVCNHIFYEVQYMRVKEFPEIKGGFIHMPFLPEQVIDKPEVPSMALSDCVRGLEIVLETIIARDGLGDIVIVTGKEQ